MDTMKKWRYKTTPKTRNVLSQLYAPIEAILGEITMRLQEATSDPKLKRLVWSKRLWRN
jgi:hypothetical protein